MHSSLGITAEALHKSIVCRFVSWEKAGDFEKDYRKSGWLLPAAWQLYTKAWRYHHHSAGPSLRYIPRRAVLYCPGNDERKLMKLATLDVDCAVLDCEDGVALSKKVLIGVLWEGMIGKREVRVHKRVMRALAAARNALCYVGCATQHSESNPSRRSDDGEGDEERQTLRNWRRKEMEQMPCLHGQLLARLPACVSASNDEDDEGESKRNGADIGASSPWDTRALFKLRVAELIGVKIGFVNRPHTEARETIPRMLAELDLGRTEKCVRVNSVSSGLAEADLQVILQAEVLPPAIMLPKVEDMQEVQWFVDRFQHNLKGRALTEPIRLVTFVETAVGLLNFKEVCEEIRRLAPNAGLHHDGVVFGSDDFCASIGATRTKDARELLYARQKVVVTTKAFGLQAIDLVYIDYKDVEGLRRQAREGAHMGFTGNPGLSTQGNFPNCAGRVPPGPKEGPRGPKELICLLNT
ncbi:hypothetical protein FQN60_001119 [Etheostoma spectabile]|uniref:HpcH/HpaI aldolase/citrate lyase domain-containing protein n=1 Tax=Etheostoma spectabile TaxID=54343 RepID=A0A5J5D5U4_9PERO|nr:hypothetical protein FQN60_001119 [Etheostoma spectabile]